MRRVISCISIDRQMDTTKLFLFFNASAPKNTQTAWGVWLDNGGKRYGILSSAALYVVFRLLQDTWFFPY